jgi:prophage tail gpP-like protein
MTEARNKLSLLVYGKIYDGWTEIRVRHGIEQIAGTFEISLTERWPNQQMEWAIPPGEFCEVKIGAHTVISGFVDAVNVTYDASTHQIKITGRDRTGDLVDCSAPSQAYAGLTFRQIADKLCAPFGIAVLDETTGGNYLSSQQRAAGATVKQPKVKRQEGRLPKFSCQNGETVFRALEKHARNEGVLLVSNHHGGLLLSRAGRAGRIETPLELGKNILSASLERSHAALYSEITVKGQASASGVGADGASQLESIFSSKTTVKRADSAKRADSQITRYRPLIIVAETQADAARIRLRAEWEVSNREAKAEKYKAKVQGWYPDVTVDDIWRINSMVRVIDPLCRVDGDLLLAAVTFRLDETGTTAELELTSPQAFDQLPVIPAPPKGSSASGGAPALEHI